MNKNCFLIFPHQLYIETLDHIKTNDTVIFIEDPLFFFDKHYKIRHHKLKLVLHRSSMKTFEDYLHQRDIQTMYYEFRSFEDISEVIDNLINLGFTKARMFDPTDYMLLKRLKKYSKNLGLEIIESPNFLTSENELRIFFKDKQRFNHADFYKWQRKRTNTLVDAQALPLGGKWSFDKENRKRLPKNHKTPDLNLPKKNKFITEAIEWVNNNFRDHPGHEVHFLDSHLDFNNEDYSYFFYPVTHEDANNWLKDFIDNRLANFGAYEDAIHSEFYFLYHSLLSPLLNIGLLSPQFVVNEVLKSFAKNKLSIQSCEGFIRQVIGWREYIRAMYILIGVKQRNSNYFGFKKLIYQEWYNGTTGVMPVDNIIRKLQSTGYAHHIERLMVVGNFLLLSEINPNEVYKWFMEMFIDSYDWVMVPNIYGMSQFADGGLMMRKPYISSSNYICKMSDYIREGEWVKKWDLMYWSFLEKYKVKRY